MLMPSLSSSWKLLQCFPFFDGVISIYSCINHMLSPCKCIAIHLQQEELQNEPKSCQFGGILRCAAVRRCRMAAAMSAVALSHYVLVCLSFLRQKRIALLIGELSSQETIKEMHLLSVERVPERAESSSPTRTTGTTTFWQKNPKRRREVAHNFFQ